MVWKYEQFEKFAAIEKEVNKYNKLIEEAGHRVHIIPVLRFDREDINAYAQYRSFKRGVEVIEMLNKKCSID